MPNPDQKQQDCITLLCEFSNTDTCSAENIYVKGWRKYYFRYFMSEMVTIDVPDIVFL